jgi:charged multivesicular body protein 3
MLSNPLTSL